MSLQLANYLVDIGFTSVLVPNGSTVVDLARASRTITPFNNVHIGGGFIGFDGLDDKIECSGNASDWDTDTNFSVFVKYTDLDTFGGASSTTATIARYGTSATNVWHLQKRSTSGDPKPVMSFNNGAVNRGVQILPPNAGEAGDTVEVLYVIAGSNDTTYVNGQVVSNVTTTITQPQSSNLIIGEDESSNFLAFRVHVLGFASGIAVSAAQAAQSNVFGLSTVTPGGGGGGGGG